MKAISGRYNRVASFSWNIVEEPLNPLQFYAMSFIDQLGAICGWFPLPKYNSVQGIISSTKQNLFFPFVQFLFSDCSNPSPGDFMTSLPTGLALIFHDPTFTISDLILCRWVIMFWSNSLSTLIPYQSPFASIFVLVLYLSSFPLVPFKGCGTLQLESPILANPSCLSPFTLIPSELPPSSLIHSLILSSLTLFSFLLISVCTSSL